MEHEKLIEDERDPEEGYEDGQEKEKGMGRREERKGRKNDKEPKGERRKQKLKTKQNKRGRKE